jgi:hypothetical protein
MNNKKKILEEIVPVFQQTAIECISIFFGKEGQNNDFWSVVERISFSCENILIMGGASDNYQSILALGLNSDAIKELTEQSLSESDFSDMFGEFANNYCALLMDNKEFVRHFGILNQTVPILYTKGIPFLPFISGVQGVVMVNGKKLFIGYAIQHTKL